VEVDEEVTVVVVAIGLLMRGGGGVEVEETTLPQAVVPSTPVEIVQ
jgi:hypothetical protein